MHLKRDKNRGVLLSDGIGGAGAWSRDLEVEEIGHPLQTSWARNMVPDVHSFIT